jgi:hypothetical protein
LQEGEVTLRRPGLSPQLHARFFQEPIALLEIARETSGDAILPAVHPVLELDFILATSGHHMIEGEILVTPTVLTPISVAGEHVALIEANPQRPIQTMRNRNEQSNHDGAVELPTLAMKYDGLVFFDCDRAAGSEKSECTSHGYDVDRLIPGVQHQDRPQQLATHSLRDPLGSGAGDPIRDVGPVKPVLLLVALVRVNARVAFSLRAR